MKRVLSNFVLFCSGVDVKFLRDNCEGERHKFYPIGLGVIITASLAVIAMMFATHAIFGADNWKEEAVLILFSLFWGLAIFAIDWGLIKTMKKTGKPVEGFWGWVVAVFPVLFRFAVAVIISYSISRPMEAKIYEKRLRAQIEQDRLKYVEREDSIKQAINQGRYQQQISGFNASIDTLNKLQRQGPPGMSYTINVESRQRCASELATLRVTNNKLVAGYKATLDQIRRSSNSYVDGEVEKGYTQAAHNRRNALFTSIRNAGAEIASKEKTCANYDSSIARAETTNASGLDMQRANIYGQQKLMQQALSTKLGQDSLDRLHILAASYVSFDTLRPGLITQLASMSNYERTPEGKDVAMVRWILLLVIICIDTAPIVIKLLTKRGTYEKMQEANEEMMQFLSNHETYANKHLIQQMSLAQKEVLTEAIRQWKDTEKGKPDLSNDYINSN